MQCCRQSSTFHIDVKQPVEMVCFQIPLNAKLVLIVKVKRHHRAPKGAAPDPQSPILFQSIGSSLRRCCVGTFRRIKSAVSELSLVPTASPVYPLKHSALCREQMKKGRCRPDVVYQVAPRALT